MTWISAIVTGFLLLGNVLGYNDENVFADDLKSLCYDSDYRPNEMSLENFLYLLEKFEKAEGDMPLEDVLGSLLNGFVVEGIEKGNQIDERYTKVNVIMHRLLKDSEYTIPEVFDQDEKCTLHFMLSYSVDRIFREGIDDDSLKAAPRQEKRSSGGPLLWATSRPRETGVTSLHSNKAHAFALGRVLAGMYVGLKENHMSVKELILTLKPKKNVDNYTDETIESLYALTVADILTFMKIKKNNTLPTLGPNGEWNSVLCPKEYSMSSKERLVSYSLLRGAIDGLLLGLNIKKIQDDTTDVRLSQILRMYYSPSGILPTRPNALSYCKRQVNLDDDILADLTKQVKYYAQVYSTLISLFENDKFLESFASNGTNELKNSFTDLFLLTDGPDEECMTKDNSDLSQDYKFDTPSDVIFVLDQTEDDIFLKQQAIVGRVARSLDLSKHRGTVTILTKNSASNNAGLLEQIVNRTSSVTEAGCTLESHQRNNDRVQVEKDVIKRVNFVLQDIKDSYTITGGRPAQIVVYFNYAGSVTHDPELSSALKDLLNKHRDVAIFAVGNEAELLKQYVHQENLDVVTDPNDDEVIMVLKRKIGEAPAVLYYKYCKENKDRNVESRKYAGSVIPGHVQHFTMYPETFHSSNNMKITVEPTEGSIMVCKNRGDTQPEDNEKENCITTTDERKKVEYSFPAPCKRLTVKSCHPINLAIIGQVDSSGKTTCTGVDCRRTDEIEFTIQISDARCGNAAGFLAPTLQLFFLLPCLVFFALSRQLL